MNALATLTPTERAIIALLRRRPGISRARIAAELGLSPALLTKSMTGFLQADLVQEERDSQHRGRGQPALRLTIRPGAVHAIGVSLATSGISVAALDLAGEVTRTRRLAISAERTEAALEKTFVAIADLLHDADECAGIGLWMPALQDRKGAVVEVTPSQRGIDHDRFRCALAERFATRVWLESKSPALHEAMQGEGNDGVVYMVFLDYGVGGSLIDRMRLFRGGFGEASNIGAMLPEKGVRPSLPDLAHHLGIPTAALSTERVQDLATSRPPELQSWLESRGAALSLPLSTVVHLINPTEIVLGGLFPAEILAGLARHVRLDLLDHPGRRPLTKPDLRVASVSGPDAMAVAAASVPFVYRLVAETGR